MARPDPFANTLSAMSARISGGRITGHPESSRVDYTDVKGGAEAKDNNTANEVWACSTDEVKLLASHRAARAQAHRKGGPAPAAVDGSARLRESDGRAMTAPEHTSSCSLAPVAVARAAAAVYAFHIPATMSAATVGRPYSCPGLGGRTRQSTINMIGTTTVPAMIASTYRVQARSSSFFRHCSMRATQISQCFSGFVIFVHRSCRTPWLADGRPCAGRSATFLASFPNRTAGGSCSRPVTPRNVLRTQGCI